MKFYERVIFYLLQKTENHAVKITDYATSRKLFGGDKSEESRNILIRPRDGGRTLLNDNETVRNK